MTIKYERVTFVERGESRTVYLRVTGVSENFLRGIEVNKDAEEVSGRDFDQRLRLIAVPCITKRTRMRLNPTYAVLEEDK